MWKFITIFPYLMIFCSFVALAEEVKYGERIVDFGSSANDISLRKELDSWYRQQLLQDCEGVSTSSDSIDAVKRALSGDKRQFVYGPHDPFNRKAEVQNLRSRLNPKGKGEIVHGWIDADSRGYADFHRERFVWLVLDDKVYPLHTNASMALSRLFDGVPDSVLKKAGLVYSYEQGKTILDQLNMEEHSFKRFQAGKGGQPFPNCSENK